MKREIIVIAFLLCTTICAAKNLGNSTSSKTVDLASVVVAKGNDLDSTDSVATQSVSVQQVATELDSINNKIKNLQEEISSIQSSYDKKDASNKFVFIWMILFPIALLFIPLYLFRKDKKNRREESITTILKSNRIQNWIRNLNEAQNKQCTENGSQRIVDELKKRVDVLEKELKRIEERESQKAPRTTSYISSNNPQPTPKAHKLYAESIQDNRYVKVKENQTADAIFELTVKPDNITATVTICKDAHKKILANPTFLDGCDKQCNGNTSLSIIEEGTAIRTDDSKWMVRKQIKVEIR